MLVIFLLHLTPASFSKQEKSNLHFHPEHKFVSGKTMEYLSSPIFYDTYFPIIYKIPIPRHTDNALRLLWGDVESCTKESSTGKLCPIAYHLFDVVKRLADDMGFWKPYYANHTAAKSESFKKRTGFEVICNEIQPHFFRSYTSKAQVEAYMTVLRACSRIAQKLKLHVSSENWVVDKSIYYKMLESFKAKYFSMLPQKGEVDWAVTLNTYTSVHGLLLTNHVLESVRLASALRICQAGMIPETFISMSLLKEALQNMTESTHSFLGYQLVYSNLDQQIEEYYKLPLADCTFTDEYTMIIRILAPVKRSKVDHQLVEINTIPFLEELSNASGIPVRLCRLRLPASKLTLIETSTGLLLDTKCEPNQLCKTSEVSTIFENDACTSSLLLDDDRGLITDNCKFSCFPIDPIALPLIRRISSDVYIVVGDSNTTVHLNCFDNPKEMIPIPLKNVGALRIKLACNCHLLYSDHVIYRPRDPCSGKTTIEHILPYHWNTKTLNITLEKYEREAETSSTTNSIIDIGNSGTNNSIDEPMSTGDVKGDQIDKSIETQQEDLGNKFQQPVKQSEAEEIHCDKVSGVPASFLVQICLLWILVTLLGTVTVFLLYHVRKLTKWRELQAYKETRVLYQIPKTPDENNKIVNKFW